MRDVAGNYFGVISDSLVLSNDCPSGYIKKTYNGAIRESVATAKNFARL